MDPCTQIHRIERLEQDIKGLQKQTRNTQKTSQNSKRGKLDEARCRVIIS